MMNVTDIEEYIARRLHLIRTFSEKRVGPTVLVTIEANMENALTFRRKIEHDSGVKVTINDIIIKATGNALTEHRLFTWAYNGRYRLFPTEKIDIRSPVDVGDDIGMLIIRDVDKKSILEVAKESKENLKRIKEDTQVRLQRIARLNKRLRFLRPFVNTVRGAVDIATIFSGRFEEWLYNKHRELMGTFLISNLGSLGVSDVASPIVIPSIVQMNVSSIERKKGIIDGEIVEIPTIKLIGKLDHRITDVAQTVRFLKDVKKNLEEPEAGLSPIL